MWISRTCATLLGLLLSATLHAAPAADNQSSTGLSGGNAAAVPASADIGGTLTLAEALRLAASANPELAAARRELSAVESAVEQAGVYPNPVLSASRDEIGSDAPVTELGLSQEIELGGKRSARVAAARRTRDAAAADLQAARARLRGEVTAAYFDVLAAQERLDLAQAAAGLAQRASNAASRQVGAGKVSPVEETRARVAAAGVQVELAQAGAALETARRQLAATWASPAPGFDRVEPLPDTLPAVPALAKLHASLQNSALLTRAQLETEQRRALLELERARRIPNLTVSVGAQRSDAFDGTQGMVGISVPLPLFDRNQGNVGEAQQRLYQAQDQLAAAQIRLRNELTDAHTRLSSAREQIGLLRADVLPGARRAYDAATRGFELGKFDFLDVLDAQRTLFQARSQYLAALSQANQAKADIERILGDAAANAPAARSQETSHDR